MKLGELHFVMGSFTTSSTPSKAYSVFKRIADETGEPAAQYYIGFLQSSGLITPNADKGFGDQGTAMLYYTFGALGGDFPSELTMGYRHWAGIGTKSSCLDALPFYRSAAQKSMKSFNNGPPGGRTLPPSKTRLSDLTGGAFGAGASVVSASFNKYQQKVQANMQPNPTSQREWEDVIEFYRFHADRGEALFMFRLARLYYHGFGAGLFEVDGRVGDGGRDFRRAMKWFLKLARAVWPRDPPEATSPPAQNGKYSLKVIGYYDPDKDAKVKSVEDQLVQVAGLACGYLGRMFLRGEAVRQDYAKAFLWFARGVQTGDRESHNGLGIMFRDGLGVAKDINKALQHFQTAAQADLADANANLGKFYLGMGDMTTAARYFEQAIKHGDIFQSFYYLAEIYSMNTEQENLCPSAVSYYKMVVERGDWDHEVFWEAERARLTGDNARALLGYWVMAERGYEVAQNNVAFLLDRQKQSVYVPYLDLPVSENSSDRLAMSYWTRSAGQDNVDALVKMGDYYYAGVGNGGEPQYEQAAACYQSAAATSLSALALWNLGWMHENGLGVAKDFHLAKRYYDLATITNMEASFPITLSLIRLYIRSIYNTIILRDTKSLSIFTQPTSQVNKKEEPIWSSARLKEVMRKKLAGELEGGAQAGGAAEQQQQQQQQEQGDGRGEATLEERAGVAQADGALELEDEMFMLEGEGDSLESFVIIGLCMLVGWLVYFRQARWDAPNRNNANQNQNQPPPPQPAQAPVPPNQPAPTAAAPADTDQDERRREEENPPAQ
ncbi:HCP-like protein [Atractiella rhizophila]|nr:HCP-like protein [Atractiella rhizophila]